LYHKYIDVALNAVLGLAAVALMEPCPSTAKVVAQAALAAYVTVVCPLAHGTGTTLHTIDYSCISHHAFTSNESSTPCAAAAFTSGRR